MKVGTDNGGFSDTAGSVTFAAGQTEAVLLFEAGDAWIDPLGEGELRLLAPAGGQYAIDGEMADAKVEFEQGMQPMVAQRGDRSNNWNILLRRGNGLDVESVVEELQTRINQGSAQFTRNELIILRNVLAGQYGQRITALPGYSDLLNLANLIVGDARGTRWTFAPVGCRDYDTLDALRTAVEAQIANLGSDDFQTREAARIQLQRVIDDIRSRRDALQMETIVRALLASLATANPEGHSRAEVLIARILVTPTDYLQLIYIQGVGSLLRRFSISIDSIP